jgi:hypothetical protein
VTNKRTHIQYSPRKGREERKVHAGTKVLPVVPKVEIVTDDYLVPD